MDGTEHAVARIFVALRSASDIMHGWPVTRAAIFTGQPAARRCACGRRLGSTYNTRHAPTNLVRWQIGAASYRRAFGTKGGKLGNHCRIEAQADVNCAAGILRRYRVRSADQGGCCWGPLGGGPSLSVETLQLRVQQGVGQGVSLGLLQGIHAILAWAALWEGTRRG